MAETTGSEETTVEETAIAEPIDYGLLRGEPGTTYGYTAPDGSQVEYTADDAGVVKPQSAHDVTVLSTFGLDQVKEVADGHGGTTTRKVTQPAPEPATAPVETTAGTETPKATAAAQPAPKSGKE